MPVSKILLVESDAAAGDVVSGILGKAGYELTAADDFDNAFRQVVDHVLVIIDVVAGSRTAFDLCREIRGTQSLAAIPVLCIGQSDDVEERIEFLEAGADDVVAKPFDARELEARVEALLLRFQRSKDLAPILAGEFGSAAAQIRRTIVVFSPKGGTGTTTIAVNVAMALAERKPDRVCLIDLDLQFGQVLTFLNLQLRQSIADLARDDQGMREPELLRTYAIKHDSGLHVLAAPGSPELAELVTAEVVDRTLGTILGTYDHVVVDAGSTLDERVLTAFEHADQVVFAVTPDFPAIKAVHSLLDYLTEAGTVGAKATFVLNNMYARDILRLRDVESALGTKVAAELPYDPFLYLKAVNEGVPVVNGAKRSAAADRLVKLSAIAFGEGDGSGAGHAGSTDERKGGLFGFRRK